MQISRLILLCAIPLIATYTHANKQCHYNTYKWNTITRKAVEYQRISKPYSELSTAEIDKNTGCSVCEEDQVILQIDPLKPFKVCHKVADKIQFVLRQAIDQGQVIDSIVTYRVGKTRGDIDTEGNRTRFSNHSFGVAIDINSKNNGLYNNCFSFGPQCRLIKGGEWSPQNPKSITYNSPIVRLMINNGYKWGGKIQGKQKDFMHFSQSGY